MFEKNISRKTYNIIGMVFIFIGIAFMGLSVYTYLSPIEKTDYKKLGIESFEKCSTIIKDDRLGLKQKSDMKKGNIIFYSENVDDATKKIYTTSYIIEKCNNFVLKDYCFGEGCVKNDLNENGSEDGLYMKLDFKYQNKM